MHDEHNELGDIILNRNEKEHNRKKVLVGIGILLSILIVTVIVMGRLSDSRPVAMPALPSTISSASSSSEDDEIDRQLAIVTQKHLPAASVSSQTHAPTATSSAPIVVDADNSDVVIVDEPERASAPAPKTSHSISSRPHSTAATPARPVTTNDEVYIQVGSFSRYKPAERFLKRIEKSGYTYRFHRIVIHGEIKNKVLVGPFKDHADAKAHLRDVRKKIEAGAFIYVIQAK